MSLFSTIFIGSMLIIFGQGSAMFQVTMNCGTCTQTSGCLANLCYTMSGAINQELCADSTSCGPSLSTSFQIGQCLMDSSGGFCGTGLCINGLNTRVCKDIYGLGCDDGLTYYSTCSGSVMTTTLSGGSFTTPYTSSYDLNSLGLDFNCYFTSATGVQSACTSDAFGTSCSCCLSFQYYGITVPTGVCVPTSSPVYKFKSSVPASSGELLRFAPLLLTLLLGVFF